MAEMPRLNSKSEIALQLKIKLVPVCCFPLLFDQLSIILLLLVVGGWLFVV